MAKVLVECRRLGGNVKEPGGYRRAMQKDGFENQPASESMRRKWQRSRWAKHLNENLAPLERFLRSNVNRPWNKVFSEICKHVRLDSAVQKHIRDHLDDFVARDVEIVDGRLRLKACRWTRDDTVHQLFYVHPRSGLLRASNWRPTKPPPARPTYLVIDELHQVRRYRGHWFELTLAPWPESEQERAMSVDVFFRTCLLILPKERAATCYGTAAFAVALRQLNSREIARLRNGLAQLADD